MSRRDARETAFHLLFQLSLQKTTKRREQEEFFWELVMSGRHAVCEQEGFSLSEDDRAFAEALSTGAYNMAQTLDALYSPYLKNWKVTRLPRVDQVILRLAVYELLERHDVPVPVVINEAVLLARKYSTEDSRTYINAILGRLSRDKDLRSGDVFEEDNAAAAQPIEYEVPEEDDASDASPSRLDTQKPAAPSAGMGDPGPGRGLARGESSRGVTAASEGFDQSGVSGPYYSDGAGRN